MKKNPHVIIVNLFGFLLMHLITQVPDGLSSRTHINEENIYIGRTTPLAVVKLFQEQFQKDFKLFLTLRNNELVCGGRMVLTFLCRKTTDIMFVHGGVGSMWELLSEALKSLVQKVGNI